MKAQSIIFTDLDGTLLEHKTYSFEAALPALERLKQEGIPLILCSSKTKAEIESWRERLENHHLFISENGGGIFIPPASFSENDLKAVWPKVKMADGYFLLVLGMSYSRLRQAFEELRKEGFRIRGFGDMDAREVADLTDLSPKEAKQAIQRDFDEPFVFHGSEPRLSDLLASIKKKGLDLPLEGD